METAKVLCKDGETNELINLCETLYGRVKLFGSFRRGDEGGKGDTFVTTSLIDLLGSESRLIKELFLR